MCEHIPMCEVNSMANITLSVSDDVHAEMKRFSEVRWSEVARRAIVRKLEALRLADEIAQKSELTREDVDAFSEKIKSLAGKRFMG